MVHGFLSDKPINIFFGNFLPKKTENLYKIWKLGVAPVIAFLAPVTLLPYGKAIFSNY